MTPAVALFCIGLLAALILVAVFLLGVGCGALWEEKTWIKHANSGAFRIATSNKKVYSVEQVGRKLS